MDRVLSQLRAAAEPTRLRLLALCARGALCVSDLCEVLGQSQPRLSRHLKLLVEAGLLERIPEGANPDRLRVVGWVEDAQGRIRAIAESRCLPVGGKQ